MTDEQATQLSYLYNTIHTQYDAVDYDFQVTIHYPQARYGNVFILDLHNNTSYASYVNWGGGEVTTSYSYITITGWCNNNVPEMVETTITISSNALIKYRKTGTTTPLSSYNYTKNTKTNIRNVFGSGSAYVSFWIKLTT